MTTLTFTDLHFVMTRLPKDITELIQENNLIIAGGFIRSTIAGERVSDYDLFGATKEHIEQTAYKFAEKRRCRVHVTDNAFTLLKPPRIPVQFITRWLFVNGKDTADSFDFTICKAAIWWADNQWCSHIDDCFYSDLAARRLVYTFPVRNEDAGGSLLRARNFLMRGYTIQPYSLAGTIARLVRDFDQNKTDITNEVDVTKVLTGLLREVDPSIIVDGIDIIDEHQVLQ